MNQRNLTLLMADQQRADTIGPGMPYQTQNAINIRRVVEVKACRQHLLPWMRRKKHDDWRIWAYAYSSSAHSPVSSVGGS